MSVMESNSIMNIEHQSNVNVIDTQLYWRQQWSCLIIACPSEQSLWLTIVSLFHMAGYVARKEQKYIAFN